MPTPHNTIAKSIDQKSAATVVVLSLVATVKELTIILNKEMELIEKRQMKEHAELLKQKQRLTMDYRAGMKNVMMQPDLLKQVPESVRQSAREAAQALAEVSERNAKLLRTAIMAVQRLVQSIVSIVKSEVLPTAGYKNFNSVQLVPGAYSPTCNPVAVRRTV
jgi:hypothetical protein